MLEIINEDLSKQGTLQLNSVYKKYGLRKLRHNHNRTKNLLGSLTGSLGGIMLIGTIIMTIRLCKSQEKEKKGLGISFETFSRDFETGSSKVGFGSTPTVMSEEKITLNDQTVEDRKRRRAILV